MVILDPSKPLLLSPRLEGRGGQAEADKFGLTRHLGHDERYDSADEFLELTFKL